MSAVNQGSGPAPSQEFWRFVATISHPGTSHFIRGSRFGYARLASFLFTSSGVPPLRVSLIPTAADEPIRMMVYVDSWEAVMQAWAAQHHEALPGLSLALDVDPELEACRGKCEVVAFRSNGGDDGAARNNDSAQILALVASRTRNYPSMMFESPGEHNGSVKYTIDQPHLFLEFYLEHLRVTSPAPGRARPNPANVASTQLRGSFIMFQGVPSAFACPEIAGAGNSGCHINPRISSSSWPSLASCAPYPICDTTRVLYFVGFPTSYDSDMLEVQMTPLKKSLGYSHVVVSSASSQMQEFQLGVMVFETAAAAQETFEKFNGRDLLSLDRFKLTLYQDVDFDEGQSPAGRQANQANQFMSVWKAAQQKSAASSRLIDTAVAQAVAEATQGLKAQHQQEMLFLRNKLKAETTQTSIPVFARPTMPNSPPPSAVSSFHAREEFAGGWRSPQSLSTKAMEGAYPPYEQQATTTRALFHSAAPSQYPQYEMEAEVALKPSYEQDEYVRSVKVASTVASAESGSKKKKKVKAAEPTPALVTFNTSSQQNQHGKKKKHGKKKQQNQAEAGGKNAPSLVSFEPIPLVSFGQAVPAPVRKYGSGASGKNQKGGKPKAKNKAGSHKANHGKKKAQK